MTDRSHAGHGITPLHILGPDEPHAFDNLPVLCRPSWADGHCATCRGHGAWNDLLHLDSFRCRLAICGDCGGSGWTSRSGIRTTPEIAMVDGHPTWTTRTIAPVLLHVVPVAEGPADHADEDVRQAA